MMKSIHCLAILLAINVSGWSQITITSQHLPKINNHFVRDSVGGDTLLHTYFLNIYHAVGENHWDASKISGWKRMDTIRFSNPQGTTYGDSIPDANLLMNLEYDFIMRGDSQGLNVLGIGLNGVVNILDSAVNFFPVPLEYGHNYASRGQSAFTYFGMDITVDLGKEMNVRSYGTLTMPNDSIYEVLLVNTITSLDYLIINGKDTISHSASNEYSVDFYCREFGFPILRVVYEPFHQTPIGAEIVDLDQLVGIAPCVRPKVEAPSAWPNPVAPGNTLNINSTERWVRASLIGLDGRAIAVELGPDNSIWLPQVPTGLYVLALTNEQGLRQVMRVTVAEN